MCDDDVRDENDGDKENRDKDWLYCADGDTIINSDNVTNVVNCRPEWSLEQ